MPGTVPESHTLMEVTFLWKEIHKRTEIHGINIARSPVGKLLDAEVDKDTQEWRREKEYCKFRHVIRDSLVEKGTSEKACRK